jgi:hypothetical protein
VVTVSVVADRSGALRIGGAAAVMLTSENPPPEQDAFSDPVPVDVLQVAVRPAALDVTTDESTGAANACAPNATAASAVAV